MRAAAFVFWSVTGVYSKMAWRAQDIMHAIDSEGFLWGEDDAPVYDPSLRDAQLFDKREKGMSMSQAVRAVNESYENYSMDPGKSLNSYQVTDKQGIKNVPLAAGHLSASRCPAPVILSRARPHQGHAVVTRTAGPEWCTWSAKEGTLKPLPPDA